MPQEIKFQLGRRDSEGDLIIALGARIVRGNPPDRSEIEEVAKNLHISTPLDEIIDRATQDATVVSRNLSKSHSDADILMALRNKRAIDKYHSDVVNAIASGNPEEFHRVKGVGYGSPSEHYYRKALAVGLRNETDPAGAYLAAWCGVFWAPFIAAIVSGIFVSAWFFIPSTILFPFALLYADKLSSHNKQSLGFIIFASTLFSPFTFPRSLLILTGIHKHMMLTERSYKPPVHPRRRFFEDIFPSDIPAFRQPDPPQQNTPIQRQQHK